MSKMVKKRWTSDEDKVLIRQIELHPNSRKDAFEATGRLLDRKPSSCSRRWYNKVSLEADVLCFSTISKTQQVNNRSRATKKAPGISRTQNWWKKILKLLGL